MAPQGTAQVERLAGAIDGGDSHLLEPVLELGRLLLGQIDELDEKICGVDKKLRVSARQDEETARLMTIGETAARTG